MCYILIPFEIFFSYLVKGGIIVWIIYFIITRLENDEIYKKHSFLILIAFSFLSYLLFVKTSFIYFLISYFHDKFGFSEEIIFFNSRWSSEYLISVFIIFLAGSLSLFFYNNRKINLFNNLIEMLTLLFLFFTCSIFLTNIFIFIQASLSLYLCPS